MQQWHGFMGNVLIKLSLAEAEGARKRGRAEEASPAVESTPAEEEAPQSKRSRTGRVIVPPAGREDSITPAPIANPGSIRKRSTGEADMAEAVPEEVSQPRDAQKGRRKAEKGARKVWPPASAEQLAAAQKVGPLACEVKG